MRFCRPSRIVLLLPLLLAGCVTEAQKAAALNATIGESETDLVRQLGVPTRSFETAGHRFLAYDTRHYSVVPDYGPWGYWGGWPGFGWSAPPLPPGVVEYGCETTFEIDSGRVASWTRRGNSC